jgi:hypothetical protein
MSTKKKLQNLQIISGGQTGVDRAALDFALLNNISCGGWCPKGRIAEDGTIPLFYPLKETNFRQYFYRTEMNVKESDATLIIFSRPMSNGSELTRRLALELNKPLLLIDLEKLKKSTRSEFSKWIKSNNILVLNIAGPRESSNPGIYEHTFKLLATLMF